MTSNFFKNVFARTQGLLKSSKRKQKLYNKFLKNKSLSNEENYKVYRRLFETLKCKSKKNYYNKLIEKHKGDMKATWNVMKEIIGKSRKIKTNLPKSLIIDELRINSEKDIANHMNKYYSSVGKTLASKIDTSSKHFSSYMPNSNFMEISNHELTSEELNIALSSLKRNKGKGYDGISSNIILDTKQHILPSLKHIFSLSIKKGKFPDPLKIAKILPTFKKGSPDQMGNYRPISILPAFSKILERIIYNRLYTHLMNNKILYEKQFGFQKGLSTNHAILGLVNKLLKTFDEGKFSLGVFIDLSKAFDTVDHDILLSKLKHYKIDGPILNLLRDYLNNRKQFIPFGTNNKTQFEKITCGVPQGSILGPLLFLIYVNDLSKVSSLLEVIMFADDTNLFINGKNIQTIFKTMNNELIKLVDWFKANKLSLNHEKTIYTLFHSSRQIDNLPLMIPKLCINSFEIKRTNSARFLGVILDENMNWRKHIDTVNIKLSKIIGVMYKSRYLLDQKSLISLYYAFFHPYLTYANMVWGSTCKSRLKSILTKQKHVIRLISSTPKHGHTDYWFQKFGILSIYKINILQHLNFMFNASNEKLPNVLQEIMIKRIHKYGTRNVTNSFQLPLAKSKNSRFAISYRGPRIWNEYSNQIAGTNNLKVFNSRAKTFLKKFEVNLELFF